MEHWNIPSMFAKEQKGKGSKGYKLWNRGGTWVRWRLSASKAKRLCQ